MGGSVVRGLLSTLTAHSFLPLSPNSCLLLAAGAPGIFFSSSSSSSSGGALFRRASLCGIRVQELVCDGVPLGLRPQNVRRTVPGIRGASSNSNCVAVGISKMRKGSVECSGSSTAADTSSSETVQALPKVGIEAGVRSLQFLHPLLVCPHHSPVNHKHSPIRYFDGLVYIHLSRALPRRLQLALNVPVHGILTRVTSSPGDLKPVSNCRSAGVQGWAGGGEAPISSPPIPNHATFMALITCRHAFQATTAVAKTFVGLVGHGGLGGSRWSSCFSAGAIRSMHLAPARFARRPVGVPESQHDLYLEHADLAHFQPSVRPFEAPVVLEAPVKLLYELLQKKGFIDAKRRPLPIDQVASQDDHRIVAWYRSIAIGLLKYHSFCDNLGKVRSIANYLLRWSAIYTLAKKHKSSSSQIIAKHTKSLVISKDVNTLAAYLTPVEISQYKKRFIVDLDPTPPEALIDMLFARLVQKRLLGERCAVKGCLQRHVEMHHIRQIEKAGGTHKVRSAREAQILEGIKALQGSLNKKHIPLCVRHHDDLHMGKVFIDDLDMNVVI